MRDSEARRANTSRRRAAIPCSQLTTPPSEVVRTFAVGLFSSCLQEPMPLPVAVNRRSPVGTQNRCLSPCVREDEGCSNQGAPWRPWRNGRTLFDSETVVIRCVMEARVIGFRFIPAVDDARRVQDHPRRADSLLPFPVAGDRDRRSLHDDNHFLGLCRARCCAIGFRARAGRIRSAERAAPT